MNPNVMDTGEILMKALEGRRLVPEEANHLCAEGDLVSMALMAREITRRLNPEGRVGFAVDKTVVYSNVCQPACPFCTGTVTKEEPEAFTRTADEVVAEVADAVAAGATQVTLQGGHRIDLPWEYYTGLIRAVAARFPEVQIFAYSPTEIMVFNVTYQRSTGEIIKDLRAAGMGALIAGGAESMQTRDKEHRALVRGPWAEWFEVVHRCADAGIPVVAPFVIGLGESVRERVGHLYRVRAVQERISKTGAPVIRSLAVFGYNPAVSGHEYLRMVALARILVQNVPHIQSSFVAQGAKVAQVALDGGADDLGGTHLEFERAELAAGRVGPMTTAEMERLIRDAGRLPALRTAW